MTALTVVGIIVGSGLETTAQRLAFAELGFNHEAADCSVRALAVACCCPYDIAHAAMHFAGRGPEQAASMNMVIAAAASLGFTLREIEVKSKTLRGLTRELHGEPGTFMGVTSDHIVGFWGGECIDWARDKLKRLKLVYLVARVK